MVYSGVFPYVVMIISHFLVSDCINSGWDGLFYYGIKVLGFLIAVPVQATNSATFLFCFRNVHLLETDETLYLSSCFFFVDSKYYT